MVTRRRPCELLPALLLFSLCGFTGRVSAQSLTDQHPIDAGSDAAREQSPATQPPPGPDSHWPRLLAAQYTFIEQWQSALTSPYAGPHSLLPGGDQQPTHTLGAYSGWAPSS